MNTTFFNTIVQMHGQNYQLEKKQTISFTKKYVF